MSTASINKATSKEVGGGSKSTISNSTLGLLSPPGHTNETQSHTLKSMRT